MSKRKRHTAEQIVRKLQEARQVELGSSLAPVILPQGHLVKNPGDVEAQEREAQLGSRVEGALPAGGLQLPVGKASRAQGNA